MTIISPIDSASLPNYNITTHVSAQKQGTIKATFGRLCQSILQAERLIVQPEASALLCVNPQHHDGLNTWNKP